MPKNRDIRIFSSAVRILCVFLVAGCVLGACKEEALPPTEQAKAALSVALDSLHAHRFGGYMAVVDLGEDVDDEQLDIMLNLFCQHQERLDAKKGGVQSCIVVDAREESDSVVTVFYEITFGNGASEVCSQKMVRKGGEWKIRVRN